MATQPARVQLEIQRDEAPQIHGSVTLTGQQPVQFTGWLELISLIERMSGHEQVPGRGRSEV